MAKRTNKKETNQTGTMAFFRELETLADENGIERDVLIDIIKTNMEKAIKESDKNREYSRYNQIRVDIDPDEGIFDINIIKDVVDYDPEPYDPDNEIYIDEARKINPDAVVDDKIDVKMNPSKIKRVVANKTRQLIQSDIKAILNNKLAQSFEKHKDECVTATVEKIEPNLNAVVSFSEYQAYLPRKEQLPDDDLKIGDKIKIFIKDTVNPNGKPQLKISRTHKDLIKRLMEIEIPEVADGSVEIMSISREAGIRSKVAVMSHVEGIDPIGTCIGQDKTRIQAVLKEIGKEQIDIIEYSADEAQFIANALKPAEVLKVELTSEPDEDGKIKKMASVTIPANQTSLAIGNKGINAKLAAKLTGYKQIDIHPPVEEKAEVDEKAEAIETAAEPSTEKTAEETAE